MDKTSRDLIRNFPSQSIIEMKLSRIIYKIKCYGFKGIFDYLKRYPSILRIRKSLKTSTCSVDQVPETGITLVGPFSTSTSISKVMRDLAIRLRECAIPFQALDTCCESTIDKKEYADLLTPHREFDINRYSHVIQMFENYVQSAGKRIAYSAFFWEFESGIEHLYPDMTGDSLLAMSDFNETVFRAQKPSNVKRVAKILYPLRPLPDYNKDTIGLRGKYGIPPDAFVVYFNFDFMSSYFRKNPEAVIKAFAKAFPNDNHVILLFKTMRASRNPSLHDRMMRLIDQCKLTERFIEVKDFLNQEDLIGLTNTCDVYISLHRGEGFGLTLAEAMQLAKPVVCTNYSSTTEFCHSDNSILIPYERVPVLPEQIDTPEYKFVREWAEPDIDAAAVALRRLYDDPAFRADLGQKAATAIREQFSAKNFRASVNAFLGA